MVEDWPNGDNKGGDIRFLRDTDRNGVAESLDHFMSLQVKGAENSGIIFDPTNPSQFIINVQHPESTGVDGGQSDATWLIDLKDVVAPVCVEGGQRKGIKTCRKINGSNFVKKLIKAGK